MKKFFTATHKKIRLMQYGCHIALIPLFLYFSDMYLLIYAMLFSVMVHTIGSEIGVHRYFTHNSFKTYKFFELLMAGLYTISTQGSIIGYVITHLKHHANSDKEGDPHNYHDIGFFKMWAGVLNLKNLRFGTKKYVSLRKNDLLRINHDYYFLFIILYLIILSILNPVYIFYFYIIPVVYQFHMNSILIVLNHYPNIGTRHFDTFDNSRDIWWIKPLTMGAELHNTHHYYPQDIDLQKNRDLRYFDPSGWLINIIKR